jgi:hypothetical protein
MSNEVVEQPELTGMVGSYWNARVTRYGLPCAKCRIYYSSELIACPHCKCKERVSAIAMRPRSVVRW